MQWTWHRFSFSRGLFAGAILVSGWVLGLWWFYVLSICTILGFGYCFYLGIWVSALAIVFPGYYLTTGVICRRLYIGVKNFIYNLDGGFSNIFPMFTLIPGFRWPNLTIIVFTWVGLTTSLTTLGSLGLATVGGISKMLFLLCSPFKVLP